MPVIKNEKPMVTLAGVTLPLSIALLFNSYGSVSARYTTLRLNGAAYQVPVGKKLILVAVEWSSSTAAGALFSGGYGDTSVLDSASAPTNFVSNFFSPGASGASVGAVAKGFIYAEVPAGKYPVSLTSSAPAYGQVLGYLVDV
jgi:hypothetical protein